MAKLNNPFTLWASCVGGSAIARFSASAASKPHWSADPVVFGAVSPRRLAAQPDVDLTLFASSGGRLNPFGVPPMIYRVRRTDPSSALFSEPWYCDPDRLASPTGVACTKTHVFVANSGKPRSAVYAIPVGGGGPAAIFAPIADYAGNLIALTACGDDVYYATSDAVYRIRSLVQQTDPVVRYADMQVSGIAVTPQSIYVVGGYATGANPVSLYEFSNNMAGTEIAPSNTTVLDSGFSDIAVWTGGGTLRIFLSRTYTPDGTRDGIYEFDGRKATRIFKSTSANFTQNPEGLIAVPA